MTDRDRRLTFGLAIDFGSDVEPLSQRVERMTALLRRAEKLGFDSIWAGESYPTKTGFFHLPSPMIVLGALAPQTGLTLGTGVTLLPAWNPLRLAYDAAVLDHLSAGRFVLGAAGGNPFTWEQFGVPRERLAQRLDETLEALRALWSGADGFQGEFVRIDAGIRPLPARDGGPPIWLGGLAPRVARRAARLADAWYAASSYRLDTQITPQVARYREAMDTRPTTVAANRFCVIADTDAEARRIAAEFVEPQLQTYAALGGLRDATGEPLAAGREPLLPAMLEPLTLVGDPDSVNGQLEAYAASGVTHMQMRVSPSDMPPELTRQTVELAGSHIIPRWA